MSNNRAAFILTGGGLLTLAILGFTTREFHLGPFAARLASWSPMIAYGTFGAAALLGTLLLVFAPSSRRVERRVRLDRPDAENPVMARPSSRSGIPTTSGMAAGSESASQSGQRDHGHSSKVVETAGAPRGVATAHAATSGDPAPGWAHPNDAGHEPTAPTPAPATVAAAPGRPAARRAAGGDDDTNTLRARLAELDRQANHAKVRYGLGQLSPNGYRAVLAKLNDARASIEETLLGDLEV